MNNSNAEPESFDVFLCHNSEDKPEIRRIADDLIKQGIKPWLDEREIRPGSSWQEALEEQIDSINAAAIFIGANGIGPWQNQELRAFIMADSTPKCNLRYHAAFGKISAKKTEWGVLYPQGINS